MTQMNFFLVDNFNKTSASKLTVDFLLNMITTNTAFMFLALYSIGVNIGIFVPFLLYSRNRPCA